MPRLTVEQLVDKYNKEKCYVELRNGTWCLIKDGKVQNRITSRTKANMFLEEIMKDKRS